MRLTKPDHQQEIDQFFLPAHGTVFMGVFRENILWQRELTPTLFTRTDSNYHPTWLPLDNRSHTLQNFFNFVKIGRFGQMVVKP